MVPSFQLSNKILSAYPASLMKHWQRIDYLNQVVEILFTAYMKLHRVISHWLSL